MTDHLRAPQTGQACPHETPIQRCFYFFCLFMFISLTRKCADLAKYIILIIMYIIPQYYLKYLSKVGVLYNIYTYIYTRIYIYIPKYKHYTDSMIGFLKDWRNMILTNRILIMVVYEAVRARERAVRATQQSTVRERETRLNIKVRPRWQGVGGGKNVRVYFRDTSRVRHVNNVHAS